MKSPFIGKDPDLGKIEGRRRSRQQSLMDSMGEGEGGKIWENGIETCKISCMKRDASPGSMHDTGCLGPLLTL